MTPPPSLRRRRLAGLSGLSGLLAGIALLVAARVVVSTPQQQQMTLLPAVPPPTHTATTPPPASPSPSPSSVTAPASTAPATTAPAPAGPRTVVGDLVDTPYGPMQVAVVFSGGKIVDVRALQTPNDEDRSVMLAQLAVPILRQEVLTAQSARVDSVSGATYTSQSYAQSVQYAIDHAH